MVEGINIGMQHDIKRAELIALPIVAILLYFVFGGMIGALLPVLIGGMTILGTPGSCGAHRSSPGQRVRQRILW